MYYFRNLRGDLKFKVKGVNTNVDHEMTLQILVDILVSRGKLTFTNQIAFLNLPLKEGSGVLIKENLTKSFNIVDTKPYTTPFVFTDNKVVHDLPDYSLNTDEQLMNTIISIPLKDYKVLRTGRLSQVCPGVLQY
ncbi:hypothetical protein BpHYR1_031988, partial [Brachionus plicatilis]